MNRISRRSFVASLTVLPGAALTDQVAQTHTAWHDAKVWGLEGKCSSDTERFYDRLPAKARGIVPDPVWNLSRHSAGMRVRFRTDSGSIYLRMDLLNANLAMPHMPATGVSGFDLYAFHKGKWQWVKQAMPSAQRVEGLLIDGLAHGMKEFAGYLPLYNGVEKLEIGVDPGARFEPILPSKDRPIVFYGTSICHGACASRPGMAFPAIVGRRLNLPVVNLGFSGNGRMDFALIDLIAELDSSIYVIDCLPNA